MSLNKIDIICLFVATLLHSVCVFPIYAYNKTPNENNLINLFFASFHKKSTSGEVVLHSKLNDSFELYTDYAHNISCKKVDFRDNEYKSNTDFVLSLYLECEGDYYSLRLYPSANKKVLVISIETSKQLDCLYEYHGIKEIGSSKYDCPSMYYFVGNGFRKYTFIDGWKNAK